MRRLISILVFAVSLSLYSFALSAEMIAPKVEEGKPWIKCSTCGAEFNSRAGIVDHIKANPGHTEAPAPLVKDTLYTSGAGVEDHVNVSPGHSDGKPLVKCSSCGVEFTTIKDLQMHMKVHPEHKLVPME
jgi:uncharacterized C2H2 Zn-finger protein